MLETFSIYRIGQQHLKVVINIVVSIHVILAEKCCYDDCDMIVIWGQYEQVSMGQSNSIIFVGQYYQFLTLEFCRRKIC